MFNSQTIYFHGPCSMAMLNNQRVMLVKQQHITIFLIVEIPPTKLVILGMVYGIVLTTLYSSDGL